MANKNADYNQEQTDAAKANKALTTEQIEALIADKFLKILGGAAGNESNDSDKLDELKAKINDKLTRITPISVAFPECSDLMLSLINPTLAAKTAKESNLPIDEITAFFNDYFIFDAHSVIAADVKLEEILDPQLFGCTGDREDDISDDVTRSFYLRRFPPHWCLSPTCVEIAGSRHLYTAFNKPPSGKIRKMFLADLVWLFYFDRMGIFKILGAILDDYAIKGKLPISNGSVNASDKDDLISIVLESMTRKTKMGLSSTVRDRNISYRRGLGWIQEEGRKLNLDTVVNTAFTNLFHKFIQTTLEFYKDKRLATAIQGIGSPIGKTSVATLTSIKDTIDLLKRTFDSFNYGRNYSNTLSGIVWVIAGMGLIREMRTTLGIPSEYKDPDEFIPAAYDILVAQTSITPSETNRYDVHRDCAENARAILLDLEVIEFQDTSPGKELELWLSVIEANIEGYRTAYQSLTGVDLGAAGTPTIEQRV